MEIGWQLFALAIILTLSGVSCADPGKCKVCDSINNTNCLKDPNSIADADCNTNCFTLIDNSGNIKRGCVSDTDKCDGKNCKSCPATSTACNNQVDLFWCKTCDSANNNDCAYWKNENSIPNELCDSGVSKCLMEIKSDKHTSRRCASKSDEVCPTDKKCKMCSESSCNKGVFPEDRRKCFQCSSDDSKCATPTKYPTDISSFPCLFYEESDKCFEHGSSDTAMSRGCHSDATKYEKCSGESPKEKCKECTSNDCNVDEYQLAPAIKCVQCSSDDPKCAGVQTTNDAKTCSSKIEYWKLHECYINKIEAGKVSRGCIKDFDCASSSATCTSCTGDACNISGSKSCYKCRSDDNTKCGEKLDKESYKSEPCRNQTDSNAADAFQCYAESWNGIVIRSCLADADPKTRKNCLDDNYKACAVCKGNDCNTEKAPNSAYNMALTSGLLALSFLVLKFF